jgi:hypothetical protein
MKTPSPTPLPNLNPNPALTRLSCIPSRIKHGVSTWPGECLAFNTQYTTSFPLLKFMESCREAARLVNSTETRDAKEILLPIFQQGTPESLLWGEIRLGEGEGGEEKRVWEVCGCKGCEKWGSRRVEVVG